MPRLQAVVCVCDLATAVIYALFTISSTTTCRLCGGLKSSILQADCKTIAPLGYFSCHKMSAENRGIFFCLNNSNYVHYPATHAKAEVVRHILLLVNKALSYTPFLGVSCQVMGLLTHLKRTIARQ